MPSKEEKRDKTKVALEGSCRMIARIARMSQIEPELTGMTIEEVGEFISSMSYKYDTKYSDMGIGELTIDMMREMFEERKEEVNA